jgi:16S rRNA (uracil1498-N3)-methyltransferase
LPSISRIEELTAFLSRARGREGSAGFVLDRDGPPLVSLLGEPGDPVTLIVGPEGGLSGEELDECTRSGFHRARLAAPVLRFETAALAAVALIAQHAEAHPAHGGDASEGGVRECGTQAREKPNE